MDPENLEVSGPPARGWHTLWVDTLGHQGRWCLRILGFNRHLSNVAKTSDGRGRQAPAGRKSFIIDTLALRSLASGAGLFL